MNRADKNRAAAIERRATRRFEETQAEPDATPGLDHCRCGAELDEDGDCPVCDPWPEDDWDDDWDDE